MKCALIPGDMIDCDEDVLSLVLYSTPDPSNHVGYLQDIRSGDYGLILATTSIVRQWGQEPVVMVLNHATLKFGWCVGPHLLKKLT